MYQELHDADRWEQAWRTDPESFANRTKQAGIDPAHSFDSKAAEFDRQTFSEEGLRRRERIIGWLEAQGVTFQGASVLDVGAASGGFATSFAQRGAGVTAVEPCVPLADLLEYNAQTRLGAGSGRVELVRGTFEEIDLDAAGWRGAYDLVFASMSPAAADWQSVEQLISCAREYCYISLSAGAHENSLMDEIWPLLTDRRPDRKPGEMGYLLQLLLLKGYSYTSLVTREMKTTSLSIDAAVEEVMHGCRLHRLPTDEQVRRTISEYLHRTYPDNQVVFQQGGRFGKVLIQIRDQSMYSRKI